MDILPPIKHQSIAKSADVQHWKQKIGASWKAAAATILQVSKDLYDAKMALGKIDRKLWTELAKQLDEDNIISIGIQKKLVVIGENYDDLNHVADALPPRYNAIYQLTGLSKQDLDKLKKSNKLNPRIEDKDIANLLTPASSHSNSTPSTLISIPIFRVVQTRKRPVQTSIDALRKVREAIDKIPGFQITLTPDGRKLIDKDD
jgi:hypothetical protein